MRNDLWLKPDACDLLGTWREDTTWTIFRVSEKGKRWIADYAERNLRRGRYSLRFDEYPHMAVDDALFRGLTFEPTYAGLEKMGRYAILGPTLENPNPWAKYERDLSTFAIPHRQCGKCESCKNTVLAFCDNCKCDRCQWVANSAGYWQDGKWHDILTKSEPDLTPEELSKKRFELDIHNPCGECDWCYRKSDLCIACSHCSTSFLT